ncbi:MAG TPA: exonuclease subunit SbcD [Saprospiraceae bacterium]|nr:exonuclease subunit SbcD [Saprospiraceae bacterium]HPN68425.1 exonuclease subunit SbcD [Saprospiraceae bacterium]
MRILHTADWHLGKQLLKEDLKEDHELFFEFLLETIVSQEVDVLLVSGDVFDYANPSNESKRLYLDLLFKLKKLKNIKIIITAGNHDSISYLESAKAVLSLLDITVIGDLEHVDLIPLVEDGHVKAVVSPVPFLSDRVLRRGAEMTNQEEKISIVKESLMEVFTSWSLKAKELYPEIPIIALGHLYVQGASISESERDIQIGNQAGVPAASFDALFDYFALGHIHKPQILTPRVRYSGSPIALSFSERTDNKVVILLEIAEKGIQQTSLPVPKIRDLVKFSGTLSEVIAKVEDYKPLCKLQAFVEMDVLETDENPSKLLELKTFESDFKSDTLKIIKSRLTFTGQNKAVPNFTSGITIAELSPKEVFGKKVEATSMSDEDKEMVYLAFDELLEHVLNPEKI